METPLSRTVAKPARETSTTYVPRAMGENVAYPCELVGCEAEVLVSTLVTLTVAATAARPDWSSANTLRTPASCWPCNEQQTTRLRSASAPEPVPFFTL